MQIICYRSQRLGVTEASLVKKVSEPLKQIALFTLSKKIPLPPFTVKALSTDLTCNPFTHFSCYVQKQAIPNSSLQTE